MPAKNKNNKKCEYMGCKSKIAYATSLPFSDRYCFKHAHKCQVCKTGGAEDCGDSYMCPECITKDNSEEAEETKAKTCDSCGDEVFSGVHHNGKLYCSYGCQSEEDEAEEEESNNNKGKKRPVPTEYQSNGKCKYCPGISFSVWEANCPLCHKKAAPYVSDEEEAFPVRKRRSALKKEASNNNKRSALEQKEEKNCPYHNCKNKLTPDNPYSFCRDHAHYCSICYVYGAAAAVHSTGPIKFLCPSCPPALVEVDENGDFASSVLTPVQLAELKSIRTHVMQEMMNVSPISLALSRAMATSVTLVARFTNKKDLNQWHSILSNA